MQKSIEDHKEFLIELRDLLKKYGVGIGFNCSDSSDIYGLHGEYMEVFHQNESNSFKICNGWGLDYHDIEKHLS